MSFSNKLMLKDWNWMNAHHGYIESRREQVRLQEELSMKERSASRYSNTKYIHEMGAMKRAQELRVDDFSVRILKRKS